jgi:hypothetical protein
MIKKQNWFIRMLNDHNFEPSSKRFVGVLGALSLIYALIYNTWFPKNAPAEYIVDSIALLTFGCLGLTSTEKIFSIVKSNRLNTEKKQEPKKEEKAKTDVNANGNSSGNGNANADTDGDNGYVYEEF